MYLIQIDHARRAGAPVAFRSVLLKLETQAFSTFNPALSRPVAAGLLPGRRETAGAQPNCHNFVIQLQQKELAKRANKKSPPENSRAGKHNMIRQPRTVGYGRQYVFGFKKRTA